MENVLFAVTVKQPVENMKQPVVLPQHLCIKLNDCLRMVMTVSIFQNLLLVK